MSDISIPGVTSKYDTQKLIEDLMKVERIPRDRAAASLENVKLQKTVWLDLGRRLSSLRDSARTLYSFQNPFNERIATSSDPAILTATATTGSDRGDQVHQGGTRRPRPTDSCPTSCLRTSRCRRAPTFSQSAKASVRLTYAGGSLNDFVGGAQPQGRRQLRAQAVNVTADSRVLVIESLRTGAANRLEFRRSGQGFRPVGGNHRARNLQQAEPSPRPSYALRERA